MKNEPLVHFKLCGAKTKKNGKQCLSPAMKNGRCRLHGGKSTGPRTPEGLAKSRRSNWKTGLHSAESRLLWQYLRSHRKAVNNNNKKHNDLLDRFHLDKSFCKDSEPKQIKETHEQLNNATKIIISIIDKLNPYQKIYLYKTLTIDSCNTISFLTSLRPKSIDNENITA